MGHNKTKQLVQGALIAAIFGVLSFLNTYTGSIFDYLICYIMVVPFGWYGYTYGLSSNAIVALASVVIIFMTGVPMFIVSAIAACFEGIFIGEALKRNLSKSTILLGVFLVSLLTSVLEYTVLSGLLNMNIIVEMEEMYNEISSILPIAISKDLFLSLIPFLLVITSILESYIILLFCQIFFYKMKIPFPNNFHISSYHLSKRIGGICILLMILGNVLPYASTFPDMYCMYLRMFGALGLSMDGLAFVNYVAIIKRSRLLAGFSFILLFVPYMIYIYIILGIVDIFFSIRETVH